jgi:hypothetical protein
MNPHKGRAAFDAGNPTLGDRAVELYQQLGNADKVSRTLGCSRRTVTRMLNARGITLGTGRDCDLTLGDHVKCAACGVTRRVNMSRGYNPHCRDCRDTSGTYRPGTRIRCGTVDGHRQHSTYNQPPCKPCRLAIKGIEVPEPFPRCTSCGKLIRTNLTECAACRRGITTTPATEPEPQETPEPVIHWVKDKGGIYRGVVRYEPQSDDETCEEAAA